MKLRRYWLSFNTASGPWRLQAGMGVSAEDRDDAIRLVRERLSASDLATLVDIVEDVDVSTLDPHHVLPNIGDVTVRGIWFPMGFAS